MHYSKIAVTEFKGRSVVLCIKNFLLGLEAEDLEAGIIVKLTVDHPSPTQCRISAEHRCHTRSILLLPPAMEDLMGARMLHPSPLLTRLIGGETEYFSAV